jgi:hypothetical protein
MKTPRISGAFFVLSILINFLEMVLRTIPKKLRGILQGFALHLI